jgi:hypothetical protein
VGSEKAPSANDFWTEFITTTGNIAVNQSNRIGINLMPPQKGVVSDRFRNVSPVMVWSFAYPNPAPTNPAQYFI